MEQVSALGVRPQSDDTTEALRTEIAHLRIILQDASKFTASSKLFIEKSTTCILEATLVIEYLRDQLLKYEKLMNKSHPGLVSQGELHLVDQWLDKWSGKNVPAPETLMAAGVETRVGQNSDTFSAAPGQNGPIARGA